MDISQLPKGALPDPRDDRDLALASAFSSAGAATLDWTQEFRLPVPTGVDQGSSDACVACAWSYYHWQLKSKQFSIRDLFCRIYLDYGAYIRDGGVELVKNGQADHQEVKDPSPMTMVNMRSSKGTSESYRIDDREYKSFVLQDQTIDGVAWGLRQYRGVVFGVVGTNEGWRDLTNPRPPEAGESRWGHALYAMGYHLHDGQKCIIAMSSWYQAAKEHHIKANYFQAFDATFNAWTLIPKELINKPMYKKAVHADGKTFAALIITPNGAQVIDATSEEVWRSFSKPDSYQLNTVYPDGKTNFDTTDCIKLPW